MEFMSKVHGNIIYEDKDIVTFKKGIPGFDSLTKFILVDLKDCEPFKLLQSLENEELALILSSPFNVLRDYEVKLPDETIKELSISTPEEVLILNTITLHSNVEKITTNLKAPLIINIKTGLGEQIIVDNSRYKIKHPIVS